MNNFVRRCGGTDCHGHGMAERCHTRSSLLAQSHHGSHQLSTMYDLAASGDQISKHVEDMSQLVPEKLE